MMLSSERVTCSTSSPTMPTRLNCRCGPHSSRLCPILSPTQQAVIQLSAAPPLCTRGSLALTRPRRSAQILGDRFRIIFPFINSLIDSALPCRAQPCVRSQSIVLRLLILYRMLLVYFKYQHFFIVIFTDLILLYK